MQAGPYIEIRIRDTGCGIDERVKQRIFEPFLTTKEIGKGTGMGLSVVYGTIKQHGGAINIYSAPGQGACFVLHQPTTKACVAERQEAPPTLLGCGPSAFLWWMMKI